MKKTPIESSRLHLALNITNMDASIAFYTALFETKPSKVRPGYAKFEVSTPPLNLTLNEATQVAGNHINHLGIEVRLPSMVMGQADRLRQLGMDILLEENTTCCYAIQDKVWVKDPDGHAWETFVVLKDTEEKNDADRPAACCSPTQKEGAVCCENNLPL